MIIPFASPVPITNTTEVLINAHDKGLKNVGAFGATVSTVIVIQVVALTFPAASVTVQVID